uniref:Putative ran-binding protein n=1 Tax=Schistosoma mansoni TaxID=6183 RepID=A0A3Q0KFL4_SCHMA
MITMQSRPLFDGAFQCLLPTNVVDASDLRQIPDNQEVFVHPSTSQSVTIDILEYVDANNHEDAARMHFDEISTSNEATDSSISSLRTVSLHNPDPYCSSVVLLSGKQNVSKFNQSNEDVVFIYMALYRYTEFQADVLVVVNDPHGEDGIIHSPSGYNQVHFTFQNDNNNNNSYSTDLTWSQDTINTMLLSLRLMNSNIFVS